MKSRKKAAKGLFVIKSLMLIESPSIRIEILYLVPFLVKLFTVCLYS